MQMYERPTRVLMKEMAQEFALAPDQVFTKQQAVQWFGKKYPKLKSNTIHCHLIRLSTNSPTRLHYDAKPGEDDFFFQIASGQYRLYNPSQDPPPIHEGTRVNQTTPALDVDTPSEPQCSDEFAYEADLKNYLAKNTQIIEQGLKLYEEDEIKGVEFEAGGRFIDILAIDSSGSLVVIELKVSRGYDRVVGQLMRYMAWIRKNLADPGQRVRGIIIAREISEDLILSCSELSNVDLLEYELSLKLKRVTSSPAAP